MNHIQSPEPKIVRLSEVQTIDDFDSEVDWHPK